MMRCEFEEKEYESFLYHELEWNCELVWSPGQCFENCIGFDRTAYIKNLDVWKKLDVHIVVGNLYLNMI